MPTAEINGTTLAYDDEGPRDGVPIVFIHGWTADRHRWDHQMATLQENWRVIRFDLRGHGDSAKDQVNPALFTVEQNVADAIGVLDFLGVGQAIVVGHSMGGMTAQLLTLTHPDRVIKLILLDTLAKMSYERSRVLLASAARRLPYNLFIRANIERAFKRGTPRSVINDAVRASQSNPRQVVLPFFDAMQGFDVLDRLPQIAVPTLIIHGRHDIQLPLKQAERMQRAIPGSVMTVIDTGHEAPIENPQAVTNAMAEFLSR